MFGLGVKASGSVAVDEPCDLDLDASNHTVESVPGDGRGGHMHCVSIYGANKPCEDKLACVRDVDKGVSVFSVYDGHGGTQASSFAAEHLPSMILAKIHKDSGPEQVWTMTPV